MGKAKKHTPEQIVNLLQQIEAGIANGKTHPIACREVGITEQTYYRRCTCLILSIKERRTTRCRLSQNDNQAMFKMGAPCGWLGSTQIGAKDAAQDPRSRTLFATLFAMAINGVCLPICSNISLYPCFRGSKLRAGLASGSVVASRRRSLGMRSVQGGHCHAVG